MNHFNFIRSVRVSNPAVEPITVSEAKEQLRIEPDVLIDDSLIASYISAAREKCENYCNRYFALADAVLLFEKFPVGNFAFDLARPDVAAVDSVKYIDQSNSEIVFSGAITFDSILQEMYSAESWPQDARSVKVAVSMGFDASASPSETPAAIKQAVLLYVSDLYEHRTTLSHMQLYENQAAVALLYPFRCNMGI